MVTALAAQAIETPTTIPQRYIEQRALSQLLVADARRMCGSGNFPESRPLYFLRGGRTIWMV